MNMDSDFKAKLQRHDFEYLNSLMQKAIDGNEDYFSLSSQHFESLQDARNTMMQWVDMHSSVTSFNIGPIDITVQLHKRS